MLKDAKNIFFVGIGGVAMCNMAILMKKMGKHVSGSDSPEMYFTDVYLDANKLPYVLSFEPTLLPTDTDLVIYTGANMGSENPQVLEAQRRGIETLRLSQANAQLEELFKTSIAVCGAHGKTSTSSLMAYALKNLGVHPSFLIGTATFEEYYGGEYDGKDYFVIEADEFGVNPPYDITPKFHLLNPTYIICTNIDYDHPDIYKNIDETKEAFKKFFKKESVKKRIVCKDNGVLMEVVKSFPHDSYQTYGFSVDADLHIYDFHVSEQQSTFKLKYKEKDLGECTISLFGKQHISNATGVVLMLLTLGFDVEDIKKSIKGFKGAKRRMEQVAVVNETYLFDDYGHHPEEISSTITAMKTRFPTRRLIVIFHPHTYSRTLSLKNEFVESLSKADISLIAPIYGSAREKKEDFPITSQDLEMIAREKKYAGIKAFASKEEIIQYLPSIVKKGDVIMTLGAGDIYMLKNDIIGVLEKLK